MTRWRGSSSKSRSEVFVRYRTRSRPGNGGTNARPPALIKILSATIACRQLGRRAPRRNAHALDRRCTGPCRAATFRHRCANSPTTRSLRCMTARISTAGLPGIVTPNCAGAPDLFGYFCTGHEGFGRVHPVLTHVPPNNLRSITATFMPAAVSRQPMAAPLDLRDDDGIEGLIHDSP